MSAPTEQSKLLGGLLALLMIPAALIFMGLGVIIAIFIAAGLTAFLMIAIGVMRWKASHVETTVYDAQATTYNSEGKIIDGESVVIEQRVVREPENHA